MQIFQSTLPRRERLKTEYAELPVVVISIHAPAKGATAPAHIVSGGFCYFNPRSREGSDVKGGLVLIANIDFNPRSREGSDLPSEPLKKVG